METPGVLGDQHRKASTCVRGMGRCGVELLHTGF